MKALEDKVFNNPPSSSPNDSRDIWKLTKVMEAKERMAESLKNQHCSIMAMGPQWTNEEKRKEFVKLRKEIKEINKQIASM